jgi:hypothetical protein
MQKSLWLIAVLGSVIIFVFLRSIWNSLSSSVLLALLSVSFMINFFLSLKNAKKQPKP